MTPIICFPIYISVDGGLRTYNWYKWRGLWQLGRLWC